MADPWMCENIRWEAPARRGVWLETSAGSQSAEMTVERDWVVPHPYCPGESLRMVREKARITVWPSTVTRRVLDFDLRFRGLVPGVSLGGSDDGKGYGGFSPRVRLGEDMEFPGQVGEVQPRWLAAVEGGAWVDVVGTYGGTRRGVVIMVHPSHPDFPLKWLLRKKHGMQNPPWPGRQPVGLSTHGDLRLRYRLVVHTQELDRETLASLWRDYAGRKALEFSELLC